MTGVRIDYCTEGLGRHYGILTKLDEIVAGELPSAIPLTEDYS